MTYEAQHPEILMELTQSKIKELSPEELKAVRTVSRIKDRTSDMVKKINTVHHNGEAHGLAAVFAFLSGIFK